MRLHSRKRPIAISRLFLASSALAFSAALAPAAMAQEAESGSGLSEIVVTAQKREQNVQDVPISIAVLDATTLQEQQVAKFSDIGTLVPGLTARSMSAGRSIVSLTLRGSVSAAVAPGTDPSVALAQDGVFIVASAGNDLDMPNVTRIEVLKGPQGTLFGRNATAGVVSVTTADPSSDFGFKQQLTFGNYDQFRSATTINTGAFGPFSALFSYVRNRRDGDVKNLGAGPVWDFSTIPGRGKLKAAETLGAKDVNSVFAALKFEPSSNFSAVYKFDWSKNTGTPEASGPSGILPATAATLIQFYDLNPQMLSTFYPERPEALNNAYHTRLLVKGYGHNLNLTLTLSDSASIKNIAAYRYSTSWGNYQLDGFGGLTAGPNNVFGAPAGTPYNLLGTTIETVTKQWSDEVQLNVTTDLVTLTAGALYFHAKAWAGAHPGTGIAEYQSGLYPNYVVAPTTGTTTYTDFTSIAGYVQGEFHVTPQLDLVGGIRLTHDRKGGRLVNFGATNSTVPYATYKKTEPSYQLGVNYKPADGMLLYGKFAHSYVSGGAIGPLSFPSEKADSFELGIKADLLDRRVRTNLALYTVKYTDKQTAASGQLFCTNGTYNGGNPASCPGGATIPIGVVAYSLGDARSKGFELETTVVPVDGLTLTGNLAYTDFKYLKLSPIAAAAQVTGGTLPKWGANIGAQYDTGPVFDGARLVLSADANYHSSQWYVLYANLRPALPGARIPSAWVANARAEFKGIDISGHSASIGAWVRNLTDNKAPIWGSLAGSFTFHNFQPARTFGVDLSFEY